MTDCNDFCFSPFSLSSTVLFSHSIECLHYFLSIWSSCECEVHNRSKIYDSLPISISSFSFVFSHWPLLLLFSLLPHLLSSPVTLSQLPFVLLFLLLLLFILSLLHGIIPHFLHHPIHQKSTITQLYSSFSSILSLLYDQLE